MKLRGRSPRVALAVLAAMLAALVVSACGGSSSSGGSAGASQSASSKNASATTTTASTSTTASAARSAFTTCLKQHGVSVGSGFRGGFGGRRTGTGTVPKITANGTSTTNGGSGTPGGAFPGGGGTGGGASGGAPNGAASGGGFPGGGAGFAGGNSKFAKAFQACRSKLGSSGLGGGRFQGRPGAGNGNFRPHFSTTALKSYVACIRKNGYAAMPEPKASGNGSFFPASVEKNAKFQAANRKCQSILLKAFRRPSAGAGAGSGPGAGGGNYTITGTSTTSSA